MFLLPTPSRRQHTSGADQPTKDDLSEFWITRQERNAGRSVARGLSRRASRPLANPRDVRSMGVQFEFRKSSESTNVIEHAAKTTRELFCTKKFEPQLLAFGHKKQF